MLGNKSDIYLELSSIINVSSIKLYIGTTMGYPTQFSMNGKLTKGDVEYHTSILYDDINFNWSKYNLDIKMNLYFLPPAIQVSLHGKFKTRKLLSCLDQQYRILIQCQNIVYVLNEHDNVQPKVIVLKVLADSTECNIYDSQNDIIEEMIHVQPDAILLNEGACKSGQSDE